MSEADVITRLLHAVEPADQPADELIAQWQEFTATLSATHHQTGPILFGDGRAETHVIAYHWLLDGGDVWVVHGHYVARIVNGRIAALTLQTISSYGHEGLPAIGPRRP